MTNTNVEIDGVYIQVRERIRPLVALLASGCSEQELRREIENIKPGQNPQTHQLRQLVERLFSGYGLQLDESLGVWRLGRSVGGKELPVLESALRCRVTVVPEGPANRMARAFKFLLNPGGHHGHRML